MEYEISDVPVAESLVATSPQGSFYVDDLTGSAAYRLAIPVAAQALGPQPRLALQYDSNKPFGLVGRGFDLTGIPALRVAGGRYYLEGQVISPVSQADGSMLWITANGGRIVFPAPAKGGQGEWRAARVEDPYGNFIDFSYAGGKPQLISYGLRGAKTSRSVEFGYGADGKFIERITTRMGRQPVRSWKIVRVGDMISEIHIYAFDACGTCRSLEAPVRFEWAKPSAGSSATLLAKITEPCRRVTEIEYGQPDAAAKDRNFVASYKSTSPALKGLAEYRIIRHFTEGRNHPRHGWVYRETTEWDESAKSGRYVIFSSDAAQSDLVARAGTIVAATGAAGENSVAIRHADGKVAFHYKLAETVCVYENTDLGPVLRESSAVDFAEKAVPLFTRQQKFFHNAQNLVIKSQRDNVTEFFEYLTLEDKTKNPIAALNIPRCLSVYDGLLEAPDEARLLKRTEFQYEFDDAARPLVPTGFKKSLWIGTDAGMSVAEVVRLDPWGHPKESINALGVKTEFHYDEHHFQKKIMHTGKSGDVRLQEMAVDPASGLVLSSVDHKGVSAAWVYDAFGALVEEWGPDLSRPDQWNDQAARIRLSSQSLRRDVKSGLIVQHSTSVGNNQEKQYLDAFGRPLRVERKLARAHTQVELTEYACLARVSRQSLPFVEEADKSNEASPVWYEFLVDDYGRDAGRRQADGSGSGIEYLAHPDEGTLALRSYNVASDGSRHLTGIEIRNRDNLIEILRRGDDQPTRYQYDGLGRMTKEIDPCGIETIYAYDGLDRLTHEESPVRGSKEHCFNDSGLLTHCTVNGQLISYRYDDFGRVTQRRVGADDGGHLRPQIYSVDYLREAGSAIEKIRETLPGGYQLEISFAPNGMEIDRKVTLAKGVSLDFSTRLTSSGEVAGRTYPNGAKIRNHYGPSGMLRRVMWGGKAPEGWGDISAPIVEYKGHDAYGRPEETHFHNGVTELRRFDAEGQLKSLLVGQRQDRAQVYIHQDYEYTAGGSGLLNRIVDRKSKDQSLAQAFEYDGFGRLQKNIHTRNGDSAGLSVESFQFGASGNITKLTRGGRFSEFGGQTPYQTNAVGKAALDQLYDLNGNLVFKAGRDQGWYYHFDADNRLIRARLTLEEGDETTDFLYDFDGSRFLKIDPDGVRSFYLTPDYQVTLYPDGRAYITVKVQGAGGTVATLTEAWRDYPGLPFLNGFKAWKSGHPFHNQTGFSGDGRYAPGLLYMHKNNIGSLLLVTDAGGAKTASLSFGVWGQFDREGSSGCYNFELSFGDMIFDPGTGLFYAGDRYYDPENMRFLSPDRARASSDPYSYAAGDSVNGIDYNGMCWLWDRVRDWWNNPKTAQVGARFQRVASVVVNATATVLVMSDFFTGDHHHAEDLAPVVLFMAGFSVTYQTINYITTGNHNRSCLVPLWRRICCCRPFCISHEGSIAVFSSMAASAALFPLYFITYNGIIENQAHFNETLIANRTVTGVNIALGIPRGLLAGFFAALPGLAFTSPRLPLLAFMQGSVVGGVVMDLFMSEVIFAAFTSGDILAQIILIPGQFSAVAQRGFSTRLLILAPLIVSANPLVAILPLSNIPGITTGPMLLPDGIIRAPFFPPFLSRLCCAVRADQEDDGPRIEELDERVDEIVEIGDGRGDMEQGGQKNEDKNEGDF
jgi:RHS repeat-associated protein